VSGARVKGMMLPVHVRRCRECGEEYRPEVLTCVDCGGPLEDADDDLVPFESRPRPGSAAETEPAVRKPPEGYVAVYVGRDLREVHPLVERLEEEGIPFHVQDAAGEKGHSPSTYSVLVPEAEASRGRRVLAPLLGEGADPEAADRAFDAEKGYLLCPACSAEMPRGAEACPDCGLAVAPDVEDEG